MPMGAVRIQAYMTFTDTWLQKGHVVHQHPGTLRTHQLGLDCAGQRSNISIR